MPETPSPDTRPVPRPEPTRPFAAPPSPGFRPPGAPAVAPAEGRASRSGFGGTLLELIQTPLEIFSDLRDKVRHLPQLNYELARKLSDDGRIKDAVFRYRIALWLAPNHQMSWYHLGTCYLALGDRTRALGALARSYKLNSHHDETIFLIATIDPKVLPASKRPAIMPRAIATEYFDQSALTYDDLQNTQRYRAHVAAEDALRDFVDVHRISQHHLDLGCGTGLVGALTARYAERIVGVDLSRAMLERTAERRRPDDTRVYTETFHQDMRFFLADHEGGFDFATAIHVFNYMGDVASVFEHIGRLLLPGGLFVFQYEPYGGPGFGMIEHIGRFGHSDGYVDGLLAKAGLETLRREDVEAYPDYPIRQMVVRVPVG